jgi:hypothetical protein
MIVVREIRKTCSACPAQWEGFTRDGRGIYVRFRYGSLRIDISGETVFRRELSDGLDGCLSYAQLKEATVEQFSWP